MEGSWRDRPALKGTETPSGSTGTSQTQYSLREEDMSRAQKALEEGRRIYVGNLPYEALSGDLERLFSSDQYTIEHIDMSIDPFTGRNPSYCFIELSDSAQAKAAIDQLNGKDLLGRPVKINLATSSTSRHRTDYIHDRWRPTGARPRFDGATDQGRRLYIGGLPRMPDQATVNTAMRELFAGWEVDAVSKIISPHESKKTEAGNHYYVFVDFKDALEAADAVKKLDGTYKFGGKLKINHAKGGQGKKIETRGKSELDEDWNARKTG